ncbi:uncharacterized protein LOC135126741 [Zophobas morio]|uniref:uncharacterized protein LOC135126741 n=1 Tax=Zophobas morio TaxID=2755281 RepID=UPI0030833980
MNRTRKILLRAKATLKADASTLDLLEIPKYESTKGLDQNEITILLSNRHKLFKEVISTVGEEVTSTLDDETEPYEDSGEEYIPDSEETSSDSDSEFQNFIKFPPCVLRDRQSDMEEQKQNALNGGNRNKKNVINKNTGRETHVLTNLDQPSTSTYINCPISFNEVTTTTNETDTYEDRDAENVPNFEDTFFDNNEFDQANQNLDTGEAPNSRKKRVWNKKDYCFFCDTEVMKFSRHVIRHHHSEIEVQEILALNVRSKRRKDLFTKLRNKGNFLKSAVGKHVVPVRKPTLNSLEQLSTTAYLPCKHCKGFYKKKFLYRHVKKCPHNNDDKTIRTNAQSEGQSLFAAYRENDILRKEVFPTMRPDEISFTAKTDPLICAVARRYLKSHRDKQFRLVASRKMRQLASLLIEIKKKIKVKSLFQALDPLNFDILVQCTKIISRYDAETDSYELIVNEWRFEVSTIANSDLQQKKWNKPSLIPLAEDLTLLKAYLLAESDKCRNTLAEYPENEKAFKTLTELTYVQLLLLNRRRVGELQRMTVTSYTANINNKSTNEFDSCITESEKVLMKSFKRVVIRGKRGRGVPVLFTEEMVRNTDLLLQVRKHFMRHKNEYLFANTKSSSSISGTKAIYKHVRLAGVKNPAALTSTKLRKHLATMSQVINLSEQDLEQLANFMGHTSEIHKTYYRLPSDVYQMAKVSKLLLLNEKGEASKYKGQRLDDININLDIVEESDGDSEGDDFNEQNIRGEIDKNNKEPTSSKKNSMYVSQTKKKRTLEPWTDSQKEVVLSYFKTHLKKKIPPKKNECLHLKSEHPDLFSNKSWEKMKIFVVNKYNQNK